MNEFQISVEETKKKIERKEAILIDVREQYEYDIAKIEGSILIPMAELQSKANEIKKLAGNKEVITYCHHGYRSQFAAEFLRKNGIKARSMAGGIDKYSKKMDAKIAIY